MKYLKITQLFLLIVIINTSFAGVPKDKYTVKVDGLGCPFCAYGLEKKFKEFKSIKDTKIDMETGLFTFSYPAEQPLTIALIEQKVQDAGYTPVHTKIERANGKVEISSKATSKVNAKEVVSKKVKVFGNCGMCQARIEKAAMDTKGVSKAQWNKETKQLSVSFDQSKVSLLTIEKNIATSGHDTQNAKASTAIYEKLPGCCHYRN